MKYSYQQIQESDDRIWELFGGKCVRCDKGGHSIHEIIPRSLNVNWLEDANRVVLCIDCHSWAHSMGTKASKAELTKKRKEWLKLHGKQ